MDRRLHEAVLKGDIPALLNLIQEDENIIKQTTPGSLNSVLHLAARFGHVEFASEIVKLAPEMVSAENERLETPLHEACKEGQVEIMRVLVEIDPWVAYKMNQNDETVLFVACERGKIGVVRHLLNYQTLLTLELDKLTTSLHVAALAGHTDIVKEIVKARSDFAWKKDLNGCTPLHLACSKGHLEITRELLKLDPDLSSLPDNDGRTPLHWAASKGRVSIIDEILSANLDSAFLVTKRGETVLHLGVKNNQYDAVRYLVETLDVTNLINFQDVEGNTVLHHATSGKLSVLVIYLLKLGIDVNAINRKGYTALDVVESDASNSGTLAIVPALQDAGAKRCDQLPPGSPQIHRIFAEPISGFGISNVSSPNVPRSRQEKWVESPIHRRHHHVHRKKQKELQNEGLRNARKTITIVAVLIATVTFAAGINPPGGFDDVTGKSILAMQTSFKVFMVCNVVALFLSLGIVIFLVSIIPFKRKSVMRLLGVTHKIMWVSTSFMAVAYIAGTWTIVPSRSGTKWVLAVLVSVGGGSTLVIFVGLAVLLARHWIRKWEWRKRKEKRKERSPNSSISRVGEMAMKKGSRETTSNSDMDSSEQGGYHLY